MLSSKDNTKYLITYYTPHYQESSNLLHILKEGGRFMRKIFKHTEFYWWNIVCYKCVNIFLANSWGGWLGIKKERKKILTRDLLRDCYQYLINSKFQKQFLPNLFTSQDNLAMNFARVHTAWSTECLEYRKMPII